MDTPSFNTGPIYSLDEELTEARKVGLPLGVETLQTPLPPVSENAAPLCQHLAEKLQADPDSKPLPLPLEYHPAGPLTAQQAEACRTFMMEHTDIVSLIHEAAKRPSCVFERDWKLGMEHTYPELPALHFAGRWLNLQSALCLDEGKPEEALQALNLGLQIASHAASEPTLAFCQEGIASHMVALQGFQRILHVEGKKPGVPSSILECTERHWTTPSLAYALRGEYAQLLRIRQAALDQMPELPDFTPSSTEEGDEDRKRVATEFNKIMTEGLQLVTAARSKMEGLIFIQLHLLRWFYGFADLPYYRMARLMKRVKEDIASAPPNSPLLAVLPSCVEVFQKRSTLLARLAILRSAAEVFDWHQSHGAFPDSLVQTIATVPLDPFDGQPLRYRRESNGFVLFSVGESGTFDGGTPGKKANNGEILFRYPRRSMP